jgi:uncharacterized protein (TIGR00297 family)
MEGFCLVLQNPSSSAVCHGLLGWVKSRQICSGTWMEYLDDLLIALVSSVLVAVLAYWRGSLSRSGLVGATIVGTLVFGFGGWAWGLTLIAFFISSSALSHHKASRKANLADKFEKGHQRDLGQTLANGAVGALCAMAFARSPDSVLFCAFVAAIATVNADTWATELGVLNPTPPRLITSGRTVEVGTSGAVSRLGLLASAAGALTIGVAALVFVAADHRLGTAPDLKPEGMWVAVALVGGMAGSLFDSVLGASVQAIYVCPQCKKETEKTLHRCGTPTQHERGWRWLTNDWVNLISSAIGALVGAGLCVMLH